MIVGNPIMVGGGGNNISSIIINGVISTATVTCVRDGKSYSATWNATENHWEIVGLPLGTFSVTAISGTATKTETVLIDIVGVYSINLQRIPSEYAELAYIESTGTQYIDTGILSTAVNRAKYKIKITSYIDGTYITGTDGAWQTKAYGFMALNKLGLFNNYGSSTEENRLMSNLTIDTDTIYTVDSEIYDTSQRFTMNGDTVTSSTTIKTNSYTNYIFANNRENTAVLHSCIRLYYMEYYNGDELVANYIPCYRRLDGAVGLYDDVTGKFFGNSGSGGFIAGDPV